MRDPDNWRPTKYVLTSKGLQATPDLNEVGVSSRLIANIVARFYDRTIPVYASGRLLDLGCGSAPLFGAYAPHVDDSVCVDWANSLHINPHLDHMQDINEPLQLDSECFDAVILSDVLEHVRHPGELLCEISRVLRPNGTLMLNVPFMYWLHEEPYDYYRFTQHALRYLTEVAGLEIIELEAIGGLPEVLADMMSKMLAQFPVIGNTVGRLGASILQSMTAEFVNTSIGSRASKKTSSLFPLGYAMVARKRDV